MRIAIVPRPGLIGVAHFFEASDHHVISGTDTESGTIDSQVAFLDENGRQLDVDRARLNPEQYSAWDNAGPNDDAYFTRCQAENHGAVAL